MSTSSGPDRLLSASSHVTTEADGQVVLRMGQTEHDDYEAVSVPTLLDR